MYDNRAEIEFELKQGAEVEINENINNLMENGDEYTVVDLANIPLSVEEIDQHMNMVIEDKALEVAPLFFGSTQITDDRTIATLCEDISFESIDEKPYLKAYFLESADFAIVLIAIKVDRGSSHIFIRPLESYPKAIAKLWQIVRFERKGNRIEDIKFVDAKDLKPTKKPRT